MKEDMSTIILSLTVTFSFLKDNSPRKTEL